MLSKRIQEALNRQVEVEASSSQFYLAMASWAESNGLNGVAKFLYGHSDEERQHMLKLFKYINERGGRAIVPNLSKPSEDFESINFIFQSLYDHEVKVTSEINGVVELCLNEKDYTTHNFIQWYVAEQIEEEGLAADLLDKLKLIGGDKGGLYLFDRDLDSMNTVE
jgi:ferritin